MQRPLRYLLGFLWGSPGSGPIWLSVFLAYDPTQASRAAELSADGNGPGGFLDVLREAAEKS